jgi:two-component system, OmpR family, response regulator
MVCENKKWMPAMDACRGNRRCAKAYDFGGWFHHEQFMKLNPNILIVEDDEPVAVMMVQILSQAGCNVLAVHTGKRGLELALENCFDLIALDVGLPDVSGFDICRELKQRHISRNTPVVFVSGQSDQQNMRRGLKLGAVDYIEKPFGPEFVPRLLSHVASKVSRKVTDT